jgi:hypothetical protein
LPLCHGLLPHHPFPPPPHGISLIPARCL